MAVRSTVAILMAIGLGGFLHAETLHFEVASVKPSAPDRQSASTGITTGKGRLTANEVTLKRCILGAYALGQKQLIGGPEWLDTDRFDIIAKATLPAADDALIMEMLKTLLTERFQLVIHRETRITQAYVLGVTKAGPKLEKSVGESSTSSSRGSIDARNMTLDGFAERLGRQMDLPVINQTGIEGTYNMKLEWAPMEALPSPSGPGDAPSIFTSIQKLGLRLTTQKIPVEVFVIDRAQKPSEN